MTLTILFGGTEAERAEWGPSLAAAIAAQGVDAELVMDPALANPEEVDAILYNPEGPVEDFAPFTRLRAVLSMWAGVEKIVGDPGIKVPLTRLVEPGLTLGMRDWVAAHVLRRHVGLDRHLAMGPADWPRDHPKLARERKVVMLGLGELGRPAAEALAGFGFDVTGWSRGPKDVPGIDCLSGPGGLRAALARAEFLVTLLPLTAETETLLNAETLALLPRGAEIFNPGRGALIDDDALLAALEDGQVGHATLDVFRQEPLPADHPYRTHPRVTVTPHIASATRASTAAPELAAQVGRLAAGAPLRHVVDRTRGY
ncbi:2-hydroxyacid dehydrogenase [Rhodovulum sp. DZ06]|uniref:2-hydroxyacid dehydrogenase n=1 Tax=Rhodovulum sp. DZ06 TaxID=3425126 RepID=UPI003D34E07C